MRHLLVILALAAIALAGTITNPILNGTVDFVCDNGPSGQISMWCVYTLSGNLVASGEMPDGIRDAHIIVEDWANGTYVCAIVVNGRVEESAVFVKL